MDDDDTRGAAARLLSELGHRDSAARAAGARAQTACNASERRFWQEVRALLLEEGVPRE